jgi:predicted AlkP superfamily pyrophosphatase or phosphodiesterase
VIRALVLTALAGCTWGSPTEPEAGDPPAPAERPDEAGRTVILVSIDGLRHDHPDQVPTPALDRIAAGVRAASLKPPFPSYTFPSHYTLVTGLHPEDHGIVSNVFLDPSRGEGGDRFKLGDPEDMVEASWWGGEPIWNTAERQGVRTATLFWPGSEAPIGGRRPSTWTPYDKAMPHEARVDRVLAWLDRPPAERPGFITLYFSAVDSAGHAHGPLSEAADAALRDVDAALARLLEGLEARELADRVDLVVVSDHGMAAKDPAKVVFLDEAEVDWSAVTVVEWSPLLQIHGTGGRAPAVARAIGALDHVTCHQRAETPADWHYRGHPAIGEVVCLAEDGWQLTRRGYFDAHRARFSGGTHGWDPSWSEMHGVFLASGPHVRQGATLPTLEAVDVHGVLAALLGIEPAENAGDPRVPGQVLRP